jgi:hypothetical protein
MFKRLFVLPPEIAIEVRDTNIGAFREVDAEIVDYDRCNDCFARSRNTWTEQRLLTSL